MIEEEDDIIKDVTEKTCNIIEVNAPSRRWQVDQIIKVLTLAGKYINDENICCLLQLIAATPEIQAYSVMKMFSALEQNMMQDALAKVTLWCIGEFGQLLRNGEVQIQRDSVFEVMHSLLDQKCNKGVKSYILNCCIKLFARFNGNIPEIEEVFKKLSRDVDPDIQQRAFEYSNIIKSSRLSLDQKIALLEEIPISRISANIFNRKPVDIGGEVKAISDSDPVELGIGNITTGTTGPTGGQKQSNNDDFLNIWEDDKPAQTQPTQLQAQPKVSGGNDFMDLMGDDFSMGGSLLIM
jgi:AP-1 complex subunit gamma-1